MLGACVRIQSRKGFYRKTRQHQRFSFRKRSRPGQTQIPLLEVFVSALFHQSNDREIHDRTPPRPFSNLSAVESVQETLIEKAKAQEEVLRSHQEELMESLQKGFDQRLSRFGEEVCVCAREDTLVDP